MMLRLIRFHKKYQILFLCLSTNCQLDLEVQVTREKTLQVLTILL